MMRLWPNYVQLVTVASTGIKSVEDLKGKRVGIGAPNSGVELNARMIYEAYGMTYEDSDVDYLSYGEAIDQMKTASATRHSLPPVFRTQPSASWHSATIW